MTKKLLILASLIISGSLWADSKEDGPFETFWDSEKMREKGTLQNEKLEGFYELFFRNGQLYQRANFKNGLCEGVFEYFYQNGNRRSVLHCKNGEIQDTSEFYYSDGPLFCKEAMKNSKNNGRTECLYKDGGLKSRLNFLEGFQDGSSEYFSPQGQLFVKEFWRNKKLENVEFFDENGNQLINGPLRYRHKNNQMGARGVIKEGHSQGQFLTFYEDGLLESKTFHVDSLIQGDFKRLYPNGGVASIISFKDGLRDGMARMYALDGILLWEGEYKEGEIINK